MGASHEPTDGARDRLEPAPVFQRERIDNVLVVTPLLNLTDILLEGLPQETEAILRDLDSAPVAGVAFDLGRTHHFGTDFLSMLLRVWKRLRPTNTPLVLCNVAQGEREVLQICQLDRLWPILGTREEALSHVREQQA